MQRYLNVMKLLEVEDDDDDDVRVEKAQIKNHTDL